MKTRKAGLLIFLIMLITPLKVAANENLFETDGEFTIEQYMQNAKNRSAQINMTTLSICYGNEEISCDVFLYDKSLYVPVKSVAEFLGKTVIYDGDRNIISIVGRLPDSKPNENSFGGRTIEARFNEIPVYYGDTALFGVTNGFKDVVYSDSFNCEGTVYVRCKRMTDAFGFYRYYDEELRLHIAKESGRLREVDIEIYEDYLFKDGNYMINEKKPQISKELIEEAERIGWSYFSQPLSLGKVTSETFSYKGNDYIFVAVPRVTGGEYKACLVYQVL